MKRLVGSNQKLSEMTDEQVVEKIKTSWNSLPEDFPEDAASFESYVWDHIFDKTVSVESFEELFEKARSSIFN